MEEELVLSKHDQKERMRARKPKPSSK